MEKRLNIETKVFIFCHVRSIPIFIALSENIFFTENKIGIFGIYFWQYSVNTENEIPYIQWEMNNENLVQKA